MMRTVDQVDGHNAMANLAAVDEYNDTYFGSIKVLDAQRVPTPAAWPTPVFSAPGVLRIAHGGGRLYAEAVHASGAFARLLPRAANLSAEVLPWTPAT